ncbi:MAG: phage portal protein [Chloroflexi bacterium]|nr:phage portal protein [Chloroflexota bacterium]
MNAGEESRDGVFRRLGRAVTAPFGLGSDVEREPAVLERAMSARRILDRIGVPLVKSDDVEWSSGRHAEYYGRSTAVHAAVRVLAEAVSRPPLEVWRRVGAGSEYEPAGVDHPLQRLLDRPNDVWDGGQLLRTVESRLALWGSAYVAIERDGDGVPYEMWPLRPDEVRVVAGEDDRVVRGFIHENLDGRAAYLPEEMLWYRRFNPMNSFSGLSSMEPARSAVDMGTEALRFNRRFYVHSAAPSDMVITTEGNPQQEQIDELIERWETRLANPDTAHRPMILSAGVDMKRLGSNQSDMEFIAALQWSVEEVSRAFGVPKVFLSEFEDATLANVRTMEQFLWRNTIIPELKMLEDGINHRLTPHFEHFVGELVVRFNLSNVEAVQESQSDRAERLATLVGAGIMTVDEARREVGV